MHVKQYVLGPEQERALYNVLEPAFFDAMEEAIESTDAATTEKMKDALERWFSDPAVQTEVLASIVEVREPNTGFLDDRFDALGEEEALPLDLEGLIRAFRRSASRNLDKETQKKDSVLANMVNGGRIKALLEERRAESQRLADHRRGSLPRRPGALVGRDSDIDSLLHMIRSAAATDPAVGDRGGPRTILLGGLPGVGKTSVAAELANRGELETHFPDGVLWSSLGPTPDLFAVVAGWSRSLGGPDLEQARSVSEASSRLAAFLRGKRMLMVVDDVFEPEYAVALKVLHRGVMLVSSRSPQVLRELDASPEHLYRLEPLREEDSVELLRRHAPSLSQQEPGPIVKLACELGGLPLFLKVAGRLLEEESGYGLDAPALLEDLRAGKILLKERAPADVVGFDSEETRTLEALMLASFRGLDENARVAFQALGTMAGKPSTFDMEAAEAVWDSGDGRTLMRPLRRRISTSCLVRSFTISAG